MNLVWIAHKPNNQSATNIKAFRIAPDNTFELYSLTNSPNKLKWSILKEFNLNEKYGMRLRNKNGRLVPIGDSIQPNTKESPYFLELFVPAIRDGNSQVEHVGNRIDLDATMVMWNYFFFLFFILKAINS